MNVYDICLGQVGLEAGTLTEKFKTAEETVVRNHETESVMCREWHDVSVQRQGREKKTIKKRLENEGR